MGEPQPHTYTSQAAELRVQAQELRSQRAALRLQAQMLKREQRQLLAQAAMRHERLRADGWIDAWRRLTVTARDGGSADAHGSA